MTLWEVFESGGSVRASLLYNLDAFPFLEPRGLIVPHGTDRRLPCPECGGRCSLAEQDAETGAWFVYCGVEAVSSPVDNGAIRVFRVVPQDWAREIGRDIGASLKGKPQLVKEILYEIGQLPADTDLPPLFLARGLERAEKLDEVLGSLARRKGAVILTASEHPEMAGIGSGIHLLPIEKFLCLDADGRFRLDEDGLRQRLALPAAKRGSHLKPLKDWRPVANRIRRDRIRAGAALPVAKAECEAIARALEKIAEKEGCMAVKWNAIYKAFFAPDRQA